MADADHDYADCAPNKKVGELCENCLLIYHAIMGD